MATKAEILAEKTFKGDTDSLGQRVYYSLTDAEGSQAHRSAKTISLLIEHLHRRDLITTDEIDRLLLEVVGS